ncbi:MAG: 50S ribosomal protein L21 [Myxococcales bacterium]|jgi:large subunit ribosomal protein L21|nr:50S ribosomal protein L21 [Myxococcales bacterium]
MYAIIKTGGKQYRVQEGDVLQVELLEGGAGDTIRFDDVLMIGGIAAPKIGAPVVQGAKVEAKILGETKGPKVLNFRKNYFGWTRARGHRQRYTEVKITGISA